MNRNHYIAPQHAYTHTNTQRKRQKKRLWNVKWFDKIRITNYTNENSACFLRLYFLNYNFMTRTEIEKERENFAFISHLRAAHKRAGVCEWCISISFWRHRGEIVAFLCVYFCSPWTMIVLLRIWVIARANLLFCHQTSFI
jgi:hypothetical protein